MNKRLKGFIAGVLICSIFFSAPILAAEVTKTIKVVFNQVTVKINGKTVGGDNIIYNNNVYIRADKVSESLGKTFEWDKKKNVFEIKDKPQVKQPTTPEETEIVKFNDKNLEDELRKRLKINSGDITTKELKGVYQLYISDKEISDLEGIQHCTNLTTLDLNDCNISNIEKLSTLLKLQNLRLRNNKIKDITPLSKLTNLKKLDISGNPINDISILKSLDSLEDSNGLFIKDGTKYLEFSGYQLAFKIDKKIYIDQHSHYNYLLDDNNNIYVGTGIQTIMDVAQNNYTITKSDNPYIDGYISSRAYIKNIETQIKYTGVSDSYKEGKIYSKDKTKYFEFSCNPQQPKGCLALGHKYYLSLNDVMETLDINYKVEYNHEDKLFIMSFE